MAKARMLHKKISVSSQVNRLSLPVRLLFTWMIAHADDEGRIKGEPEYIKATVIPMVKWSFRKIKDSLEIMKNEGLIYYWKINDEWFIEFVKWGQHQVIREDRRKSSDLPSFSSKIDNQLTTKRQPDDNQKSLQSNISEYNPREFNKSESNEDKPIADKNSFKATIHIVNPKTFEPQSEDEVAAKDAWDSLEPYNPLAFQTTYLKALRRGLPPNLFYQFTSEIKQDLTVQNKGAIFNKKVNDYFARKGGEL